MILNSHFNSIILETDLVMTTIFKKIIDGEIPSQKIYEDDLVLAFKDIHAQAPCHILLIPKVTTLDRLSTAREEHQSLLGYMLLKTSHVAKLAGFDDFRVVINNGEKSGQTVFHLHLHILAGRDFHWPPG